MRMTRTSVAIVAVMAIFVLSVILIPLVYRHYQVRAALSSYMTSRVGAQWAPESLAFAIRGIEAGMTKDEVQVMCTTATEVLANGSTNIGGKTLDAIVFEWDYSTTNGQPSYRLSPECRERYMVAFDENGRAVVVSRLLIAPWLDGGSLFEDIDLVSGTRQEISD